MIMLQLTITDTAPPCREAEQIKLEEEDLKRARLQGHKKIEGLRAKIKEIEDALVRRDVVLARRRVMHEQQKERKLLETAMQRGLNP